MTSSIILGYFLASDTIAAVGTQEHAMLVCIYIYTYMFIQEHIHIYMYLYEKAQGSPPDHTPRTQKTAQTNFLDSLA